MKTFEEAKEEWGRASSRRCPKCTQRSPFVPRYRASPLPLRFEVLDWTCERCGYSLPSETADHAAVQIREQRA